jgi:trehalose-6-phosphatase
VISYEDLKTALESFDPPNTIVASDFDGPLCEYNFPHNNSVIDGVAFEALTSLAIKANVAIISGRSAPFLFDQLSPSTPGEPVMPCEIDLLGEWGSQMIQRGDVIVRPTASVQLCADVISGSLREQGIGYTNIATYPDDCSFAIHFEPGNSDIAAIAAHIRTLRETMGLYCAVRNYDDHIRVTNIEDKGLGLRCVAQMYPETNGAIFIGDDTSDVAAFSELDRMSRAGMNTLMVLVISRSTSGRLIEGAKQAKDILLLHNHHEAARFLKGLDELFTAKQAERDASRMLEPLYPALPLMGH